MPQLTATIPEDLALNEGEEMDLHVVVVDGAFVVTQVLKREGSKVSQQSAGPKLGDWGRKWAGSSPVADWKR